MAHAGLPLHLPPDRSRFRGESRRRSAPPASYSPLRNEIMRIHLFHDEPLHLPLPVAALFTRSKCAWLWLPIRIYLGYQWFSAGWAKLRSPAWVRSGEALAGFWGHAVYAPVGGDHGVVYYGWYHAFLQYALMHHWAPWFAKLIAGSETTIGVLLILGAFTGLVAL